MMTDHGLTFGQRIQDWFFTLLYKLISHKIWLMVAATVMLCFGILTVEVWKWVAVMFLGANVGVKAFNFARGKINGDS